MRIYCIIQPITTPQWEYTASSGQSQPFNENILHHPANNNSSMRIYCIIQPITTPQ
jgi:hypothetical protein